MSSLRSVLHYRTSLRQTRVRVSPGKVSRLGVVNHREAGRSLSTCLGHRVLSGLIVVHFDPSLASLSTLGVSFRKSDIFPAALAKLDTERLFSR